ncbi:PREDICTED: uncharacterized protein LOC107173136 [Diuraphis noxia]|uniref:uncharacterized protein LOC107173136 n=1 Tax=Diuraphis noxia TaxID=143948 RepID=UPI0007636AEB|nr:PREDICTED: uncharacterized protein LOC107173136 [Diuraphis noxia]
MATNGGEEGSLFDLDTVRSLHKTVIALRTALERSKAELELVKKSCGAMDDKKIVCQNSEETDEIELIFTTDDNMNVSPNEDLVSIDNVLETDISKCGANSKEMPNSKYLSPLRPILKDITLKTQEVEAQTDITALPLQWRSEGFLINQAKTTSPNTTLPSKFIVPVDKNTRKQCLRVSKKTTESRRVMLSDINFTSMVPELSRSVDHLCRQPGPLTREPSRSKFPRSPGYFSVGSSSSRYDFGSVFSVHSSCYRCQVRPSVMSLEARHNASWSSVPSSPTKCRRSLSVPCEPCASLQDVKYSSTATLKAEDEVPKKIKNRVSFKESGKMRLSMPDLRKSEGDSTDSLIEESECVVRNAIDCLITGCSTSFKECKKHRRYSEPYHMNIDGCSMKVHGKPYLPKSIYDLQLNAYVKVITSFGKVVGGRLRYIGHVATMTEPLVGVQFDQKIGDCDGSLNGIRYFECGINNGQFVPFQKIVMAWRDI